MREVARIRRVEPVRDYVVRLTFADGAQKDVDLRRFLHGPVFQPMLRDRREFLKVFVDPESETIAWPNGADICPDVLYYGLTTAWEEAHGIQPTPADLAFRQGQPAPALNLGHDSFGRRLHLLQLAFQPKDSQ